MQDTAISSFNEEIFHSLCDQLAKKDADLKNIIKQYGYPPLWNRKPGFDTLIHIILEQQVSLASAKAALDKLKEKIGNITPKKLLALTDAELKACYFSRQKIKYARHLAEEILYGRLSIKALITSDDETIKTELKKVKGIGNWTADVFLMMCLNRCNCFPTGDIALMNSAREIKRLPKETGVEEILLIAEKWKPYRTIAAYLLWHAYIKGKDIKI